MGIAPLQFQDGDSVASLGLDGEEVFDVEGLAEANAQAFEAGTEVRVVAHRSDGGIVEFSAVLRIDTPQEAEYYRHGGILRYVLRQLRGKE